MISLAFTLSNVGSILLFIVIICVLIAWHELGHLLVAKKCNVYVFEYAIGFGPLLFANRKHETHICLRAIPLGGFCKMAGEEGLEEGEVLKGNDGKEIPSERIMANQNCGRRALILAAGGLMNLLLAIVCFYFYVSFNDISGLVDKENATGFAMADSSNVVRIIDDSTLESLGMATGDKIYEIQTCSYDGSGRGQYITFEIDSYNDIVEALASKVPTQDGMSQEMIFKYTDVSEKEDKQIITTRTYVDGEVTKIGLGQNYKVYEYNALTGLYGAWHFFGTYTVEVCKAFGKIFAGDFSNLSGLVGIYGTIDSVASETSISFGAKLLNIVYITGAISFSLGFFNLIPFPALDGGRLVFVALEAIRKKKINPNLEATIHFVGICLLFALMIIINIRDIINLF